MFRPSRLHQPGAAFAPLSLASVALKRICYHAEGATPCDDMVITGRGCIHIEGLSCYAQ